MVSSFVQRVQAETEAEHEKELKEANSSYTKILRLWGRVGEEMVISGAYDGVRVANIRDLI